MELDGLKAHWERKDIYKNENKQRSVRLRVCTYKKLADICDRYNIDMSQAINDVLMEALQDYEERNED